MAVIAALAILLIAFGCFHRYKPLPAGLSMAGPERPAAELMLLTDRTTADASGHRHSRQQIFDAIFALVAGARELVVIDMFLFNEFAGRDAGSHRSLCRELTAALIDAKRRSPELTVVLITDPINTVYGGLAAPHLEALAAAGIAVTITDLDRLRDSNPLYSTLWRLVLRPLGPLLPGRLPSPLGGGRVPLASYLRLLNFKANHRKVVIADQGETLVGLVGSANPHPASSRHGNVALRFSGPAVNDLLTSERAVLALSAPASLLPEAAAPPTPAADCTVQVLTEGAIRRAVLAGLDGCGAGDRIDLAMFYLAERRVIMALKKAHRRGARLRLLLDPNKDAFGRAKRGIPNRPVAAALHRAGIAVRWAATHGEQSHAKMLRIVRTDGNGLLLLGSANFTRRNLCDLNLETDVAVRGPAAAAIFAQSRDYFDALWHNRNGRRLASVDYHHFAVPGLYRRLLSRFCEATGLATF